MTLKEALTESSFPLWLCSFSALDNYLGLAPLPYLTVKTCADVTELAKITEKLYFPGVEIADAAIEDEKGTVWYFYCCDPEEAKINFFSFPVLSLMQNLKTGCFLDNLEIYPQIKKLHGHNKPADFFWWETYDKNADRFHLIMESALFLARYEAVPEPPQEFYKILQNQPYTNFPEPEAQRIFLCSILVSPKPERALEFLRYAKFLEEAWPELAALDNVDHSKEFHPEGNVWNHTLETFHHRKDSSFGIKSCDLRLSLGLLLHDLGKPAAASIGKRRFDGHAEIGAAAASRFLRRFEFKDSMIEDIYFLVRNHMLPAALGRLPIAKTGSLMDSPLFPVLMELYRCDESSSFKGMEGFYKSSAFYKSYLRNTRNPYRSSDGQVLGKRNRR